MTRKLSILLLAAALIFTLALPLAGEGNASGKFPELAQFHDIMRTLFHDNLTSDDFKGARETVTKMAAQYKVLKAAKIPEDLADNTDALKAEISTLGVKMDALSKAAAGADNEALKAAAEELHNQFRKIMGLVLG